VTCSIDDAGSCYFAASSQTCASPDVCSGRAPDAGCAVKCTDTCTVSQTSCVGGELATCAVGDAGCAAYGSPAACTDTHQTCAGDAGTAQCACKADPVCKSLGQVCSGATTVVGCAQDSQSCFYENTSTTCSGGTSCDGGVCVCPSGQHLCSGTCSLNTSPSTCGTTSCSPCPGPPSGHGAAACNGSCGVTCNTGYTACSGDCVPTSSVTWNYDGDGDGYGSTTTVVSCTRPTAPSPATYVQNSSDCCDTDANAYPGQTGWFTTIDGCNSWNYDCSTTGTDFEYTTLNTSCGTLGCGQSCTSYSYCANSDSCCGAQIGYSYQTNYPCPPGGGTGGGGKYALQGCH
jgi:hypothetical protein